MSTEPDAATGPGSRLKRAREARELGVQEVADALNISPRVVRLLEAETWSELPRPAFTRGYLRAFARLVGQDPEVIGDAYSAVAGNETTAGNLKQVEVNRRGFTELIHKQPGTVLSAAVVAAACVAGVVLWTVWPSADDRARNTETPAMRAPVPQVSSTQSSPTAQGTSQPSTRAKPPASVAPAPDEATEEETEEVSANAEPAIPPQRRPAPEPVETAPVDRVAASAAPPVAAAAVNVDGEDEEITTIVEDVPPESNVRRITPEGKDRLTLTFVNDCWVEVKNGEGEDLYSDLSRSGDMLELVGAAPFRLRLGYAPGVELAFNDERVVLTPHTRNNIASIVLGQ